MYYERTPYDYELLRNYNQPGSFNAPPWPTPRTKTDVMLQNTWCPNCNKGNVVEGFAPDSFRAAPWPTPRTAYDKALQNRWCPTCDHPMPPHPHPHPIPPGPYGRQPRGGGTNPLMENYGSAMHTPQGVVTNPYQACGNTHSSGPPSMPSTWEPIQMPMGANLPMFETTKIKEDEEQKCWIPTKFTCNALLDDDCPTAPGTPQCMAYLPVLAEWALGPGTNLKTKDLICNTTGINIPATTIADAINDDLKNPDLASIISSYQKNCGVKALGDGYGKCTFSEDAIKKVKNMMMCEKN